MKKFSVKKLNSRGAATIFIVMSILAAVLAIALGTSFVASTELRISSSSRESVTAYYAAETGIEQALYDHIIKEPTAAKCPLWTSLDSAQYCLNVTEDTPGDYRTITKIQSIGEYNSVRRSIEINF